MESEEVLCKVVERTRTFNHTTQARCSIFKMLKTNDKKKILKAAKYCVQRKRGKKRQTFIREIQAERIHCQQI